MKLLKLILLPFLPVYAAVIALRNLFFDKEVFKSEKVSAKVISVGNITVGGSGKTPLVIYLTKLLKAEGKKVGVLSRGYGRRSKGYLFVSDGKEIKTNVENCGDEIFQTAVECKVPAAVSENRVEGAKKFLDDAGIDLIILDDAFQHRWIYRDINLLVFGQRFLNEAGFFEQSLLPTGEMRERFSAVERADAIVINRKFSEKQEIKQPLKKYFSGKKIFYAYYKAIEFIDVARNTKYSVDDFKGQKSLVISGIANPVSFIKALKQTNVDTTNRIIFGDHKDYTLHEIQKIRKAFYSTNSYSVVTTEKDAVKLSRFSKEFDDIDIFYLKIEMKIENKDEFLKFIKTRLGS